MPRFFTAPDTGPHSGSEDGGQARDRGHQTGSYLTDGLNLYRSLGWVALGSLEMIGLEDCRSLEVTLVAAHELSGVGLRTVIPASADTPGGT